MSTLLEIIQATRVVAILRAKTSAGLLQAVDALRAGGVRAIEVTLTTQGALETIRDARKVAQPDFWFGAGSVINLDLARQAVEAGAQFIVSPNTVPEVIQFCKAQGIPVFPGAFTATEIVTAWESGADMVKLFPSSLGGPALIKALKAPLPQVKLMAVGGVEVTNAAEFIRAGASALGVGASLINDSLLNNGDFAEITRRAEAFIREAAKG